MSKPTTSILSHDDVLFFYDYILSKSDKDIESRQRLDKLAKKLRLSFIIETTSERYTRKKFNLSNSITLFGWTKKSEFNKTVIRHIRNAFCHKYISIEGNRCILLDWEQYKDGKKQAYSDKLISMYGNISYSDFQKIIKEFFSESSKTKNKKKTK